LLGQALYQAFNWRERPHFTLPCSQNLPSNGCSRGYGLPSQVGGSFRKRQRRIGPVLDQSRRRPDRFLCPVCDVGRFRGWPWAG
jgi:hypothetical protein